MKYVFATVGAVSLLATFAVGIGVRKAEAGGFMPVQIVNPAQLPALTRDVDRPEREPFQASASFQFPANASNNCQALAFVPAGKRLVVENISGSIYVGGWGGQQPDVFSRLWVAGQKSSQHFLVPTNSSYVIQGITYSLTNFGQSTRLYFDAEDTVSFCGWRTTTVTNQYGDASISGYLVDMP